MAKVEVQVKNKITYCQNLTKNKDSISTVKKIRDEIQTRMSLYGGHIRNLFGINKALKEAYQLQENIKKKIKIKNHEELLDALKVIELCLNHIVYLEAIKAYLKKGGKSRGSYIVLDKKEIALNKLLGGEWNGRICADKIGEIFLKNGKIKCNWNTRRKIPDEEFWFETIWNEYRNDKSHKIR